MQGPAGESPPSQPPQPPRRPGRSGGPVAMQVSPQEQPTTNFSSDPPMKRPPPAPMTDPIAVPVRRAVPAENAQMYAANLQLQAEVQGIREEMQKQEKFRECKLKSKGALWMQIQHLPSK